MKGSARRIQAFILTVVLAVGGILLPPVDATVFHRAASAHDSAVPGGHALSRAPASLHAQGCVLVAGVHTKQLAPRPAATCAASEPGQLTVLLRATAASATSRLHSPRQSRAPPRFLD